MAVCNSLNFHWDSMYWQKLITVVKGESVKVGVKKKQQQKLINVPQVTLAGEQDEQKYGHWCFMENIHKHVQATVL